MTLTGPYDGEERLRPAMVARAGLRRIVGGRA
ncbi:MAG: hypothetical protein AVDCRST_MAG19-2788 [uncultured Thermomicrobiales bacterium]|uniref:Uncharacterized protein n=1 Tax=uncultured Thermomicrobiales bacterium TaxID=1645740 RepID=A0A6J4VDN7_9BACT|nr:MAG: hypothetical protein AVDCRST_MAG19-2788 [uncultured Thermomicrobiales bacterium]